MDAGTKAALNVEVQEQEDATTILRQESIQTKLEVSELRKEMQARMMQKLLEALSTTDATTEKNPRDNEDTSQSSEKQQDICSTSRQKVTINGMDQRDSKEYLVAAMETDTTPPRQK